jgi:hypothetical protein
MNAKTLLVLSLDMRCDPADCEIAEKCCELLRTDLTELLVLLGSSNSNAFGFVAIMLAVADEARPKVINRNRFVADPPIILPLHSETSFS